jgi:hypothetical protein
MATTDLTAQRLRELLHYDPATGVFTRNTSSGTRWKAGQIAGSVTEGYWAIRVDGRLYKSHRLAWLYVYGHWPFEQIDHIDGNCSNNAISNLRDVSNAANQQNLHGAHRDSASGLLGVFFHKERSLWVAKICVNGKPLHLGRFTSAEEAHHAYIAAKRKYHASSTL